jgi:transcriptional regulator with XRE-family HTH domain
MSTKKKYGLEDLEKRNGIMTMAMCLRATRMSDEISQVDFAKKLKISKANLCDIEKGRKFVSVERAARFAKILQMPEEYFVMVAIRDQFRSANLKYEVIIKKAA